MQRIASLYDRVVTLLASRTAESVALLMVRVALAGMFWRAGRSKLVEGSWFEISDATRYLFEYEYAAVPLPPDIAAPLATAGEHLFPALLLIGLATRLSATALFGMTLVIQFFVYPEAWWTTHILWVALAMILIVRGGGALSLDAVIGGRRPKRG
ncbi:DoxX family protein [Sphingomonas sp. R647]|uniref:DoxX family protein n=1 Tax=Sphingomonas sp. R647 TaxID=2875233 RepID=UPI001CD1CD17|nr:DoxX family protein [Sphingomonas sp. R647]MCA1197003.1 DoxX family protein [Sphingomonas sp. R647]